MKNFQFIFQRCCYIPKQVLFCLHLLSSIIAPLVMLICSLLAKRSDLAPRLCKKKCILRKLIPGAFNRSVLHEENFSAKTFFFKKKKGGGVAVRQFKRADLK